jgi:hypothetical protein
MVQRLGLQAIHALGGPRRAKLGHRGRQLTAVLEAATRSNAQLIEEEVGVAAITNEVESAAGSAQRAD